MKENPERRMFGRPEKIDTTPRQSYTDKRYTFMAEQGEGPNPPEEQPRFSSNEEGEKAWNKISPKMPWESIDIGLRNAFRFGGSPGPGAMRGAPEGDGEDEEERAFGEILRKTAGAPTAREIAAEAARMRAE